MIMYETEQLRVRRFTTDDKNNLYQLNGDAIVMRYIRPVRTMEESNQRLQDIIDNYESTPLVGGWAVEFKSKNEFIGILAVFPIENSTDIQLGYSFIPKHWGKGFASEIASIGVKHAFNSIGLENLFAITEKENVASVKILQKSGFIKELSYFEDEKEVIRFKITREQFFKTQG